MLQNARVTALTVSELLREDQQRKRDAVGGRGVKLPPPLRLGRVYYNNEDISIYWCEILLTEDDVTDQMKITD